MHVYLYAHVYAHLMQTLIRPLLQRCCISLALAVVARSTPFLNIELAGNERQMLIAAMLTPRLNPLQHPQYLDKYWKGVPPGGESSNSSYCSMC